MRRDPVPRRSRRLQAGDRSKIDIGPSVLSDLYPADISAMYQNALDTCCAEALLPSEKRLCFVAENALDLILILELQELNWPI